MIVGEQDLDPAGVLGIRHVKPFRVVRRLQEGPEMLRNLQRPARIHLFEGVPPRVTVVILRPLNQRAGEHVWQQ